MYIIINMFIHLSWGKDKEIVGEDSSAKNSHALELKPTLQLNSKPLSNTLATLGERKKDI